MQEKIHHEAVGEEGRLYIPPTDLLRGEPDGSLFTVPSDYTVKKAPGGPGGRGPRGGGPPPARKQ